MNMPSLSDQLLIEHRMRSVAIGHLALRHAMEWDEVPSISISFNGKQVIEGRATAFTNGAIEAAIIHCRALLEFLGLRGKSQTELDELRTRGHADDLGLEKFAGLSKLSIGKAVNAYPGDSQEAEAALAYVIYLANKGLAHTSSTFTKHDSGTHLLEIAFRGVPILIINSLYTPLRIKQPDYKPPARARSLD